MSRLKPVTPAIADDAQMKVWQSIVDSRDDPGAVMASDESLVGPFNALVASPKIGKRIAKLGAAVRYRNSLEPRLLELAILTVGAHWRSDFEFWAHARHAKAAGITEEVVTAMAAGNMPTFDSGDEQFVYEYVTELLTTGRISDATHVQAVALLDETSVIDLAHTVGYYCLVSLSLNAFAVQTPDGSGSPFT